MIDPLHKFCTKCGAEHTAEANFCSRCGTEIELKETDSSLDLQLGWEITENLPAIVSNLLEATGRNPDFVKIWNQAIKSKRWPSVIEPKLEVFEESGYSCTRVHTLVSSAVESFKLRTESLYLAPILWIATLSGIGLTLFTEGSAWVFNGKAWKLAANNHEWVVQDICGLVGRIDELLICVDSLEDFSYQNDYLEAYFQHDSNVIDWMNRIESQFDEQAELIQVPVSSGPKIWLVPNTWYGPFQAPPAPDANAPFHRVRILAATLANTGYSVVVDFGPFWQSFDHDLGEKVESNGVSVRINIAPEWSIASDGKIPPFYVICAESEHLSFLRELIKDFGLDESLEILD